MAEAALPCTEFGDNSVLATNGVHGFGAREEGRHNLLQRSLKVEIIKSLKGLGWKRPHKPPGSNLLPWAGPVDQANQSPVQPDPEHLHGWSIHNFPGKPLAVLHFLLWEGISS